MIGPFRWPSFIIVGWLLMLPVVVIAQQTPLANAVYEPRVLQLGIYAHRPPQELQAAYQNLLLRINSRLPDLRLEMQLLSLDKLEKGLRNNQFDLVLTNPNHFIRLQNRNRLARAIGTLIQQGANGVKTRSLGGVIITRADQSSVRRLVDVPGRSVALLDDRHLGGHLAPMSELALSGIEQPQAAQMQIVDSHDDVVRAVLEGRSEVGFIRTGVLESLVESGNLEINSLQVINRQQLGAYPFISSTRLYPEWPMIALPHLEESVIGRLTAAILQLTEDDWFEGAGGLAGFAAPDNYLSVQQGLRLLRLAPYDKVPVVSWREFLSQHRLGAMLLAAGAVIIMSMGLLLVLRNRALTENQDMLSHTAERLSRMNYMQQIAGNVTAALLDVEVANRDDGIQTLLRDTGRALGVERAYLFLVDGGGETFTNTHEWCAPGISPQVGINQQLPMRDFQWWWEQLEAHPELIVDDIEAMPKQAGPLHDHLARQGIQSFFSLPLRRASKVIGFIGYDAVNEHHHWLNEEVRPVEVIARSLVNALSRWQADEQLQQNREFLNTLFESVPVPVFYKDRFGNYLGVNRAFEAFFGSRREELIGKTAFDVNPPELAQVYHEKDEQLFNKGGLQQYESQVQNAHGERREVVFDKAVFYDAARQPLGLIGSVNDITERKQREKQLALRAQRDEALLELPRLVEELDETAFMQRGQEISEDLTGSVISFIHFINDDEMTIELITWSRRTLENYCQAAYDRHYPVKQAGIWADALRRRQPIVFNDYDGYQFKHGLPEGHAPLHRLISLPVIEDGKVVMLAGVGNKSSDYDDMDVESLQLIANEIWRLVQRRRILNQLHTIAHYDALTGLPNRVMLADRINQGLAQSRRSGKLLAVTYLDLDGFKEVNDQYGHETGDRLLVVLARNMRSVLREGDTIARLGGDEFIIVLPDLEEESKVLPELKRLLSAVAQPVTLHELELHVSASIGVTFYPQDQEVDADLLLRQADQAMYQAKMAGRNRFSFFDAEREQDLRGQNENLQRMWEGLRAGEFVFHYQPKVNMRTGELVGLEALVRWQHPQDGLLGPGRFLQYAENDAFMVELGKLAIRTSLELQQQWLARGQHVPVSVNVDAFHLQQDDFIDWLEQQIHLRPELPANSLTLEVLETSALQDLQAITTVIEAGRRIGVAFSLDDFGTGYSSLTYLRNLPVIQLKIDQSFVRNCLDNPGDLAILEGVLGLATAFQRDVIAEGVEEIEHGELLLQLGCEHAQGYSIARPMPLAKLESWLNSWQPPASWQRINPVQKEDLPVLFAGIEHRAWIRQVELCLADACIDLPQFDQHQCRFGQWMDGPGRERYGDNEHYRAILPIHDQVHTVARDLLANRPEPGDKMIAGLLELHQQRDQLLQHLQELLGATGRG